MFARFIAGFALVLVSMAAFAQRQPVPIVNHPNIPVAVSIGKTATSQTVKDAIIAAAKAKGWGLTEPGSGALVATLHVRGKHTVVVDVAYSAQSYSLVYKDSINMKHGPGEAGSAGVIHPFYNRWVDDFKGAIAMELSRP